MRPRTCWVATRSAFRDTPFVRAPIPGGGEAEARQQPALPPLRQRNGTKFDFYSPVIFNAVQNEKIRLPYLSLLTLSQTLSDLGDPREERLNRSWQWLNDAASEAEDDLLRKMNFLSTSLVPSGEGLRTGLAFVLCNTRLHELRRRLPQAAGEGPAESPSSNSSFIHSQLSPRVVEVIVGDCVTF